MAEKAQYRIQESMTALVDDLDKSYLRTMQRDMHRCAAECCDKKEPSVDQVHRCIESCGLKLNQAQTFVQKELSQFQERLQRCVMVCQDRVKERVTADTSEAQNGSSGGGGGGGGAGGGMVSSMGRMLRDTTLGQGGVNVYKAEFEACAMTCVDEHIQLMPSTKRRIADTLAKNC